MPSIFDRIAPDLTSAPTSYPSPEPIPATPLRRTVFDRAIEDAGGGLGAANAALNQQHFTNPSSGRAIWQDQFSADVSQRESGMDLVKQQNPDGTATFTPQLTRLPQPLPPEELQALKTQYQTSDVWNPFRSRMGNADLLPVQPGEAEAAVADQLQTQAMQQGAVTNFGKATAGTLAGIGTGAVGIAAPGIAADLRQTQQQAYNYNPDSVSGFLGEAAGNMIPLVPALAAGPAGAAVYGNATAAGLGAAEYGNKRTDVFERRQAGGQISTGAEHRGAALSALAEFAFERVGLGAITGVSRAALKSSVANATLQYAKAAGVNLSEEVATSIAQNAIDQNMLGGKGNVMDGTLRAGLQGALIGGAGKVAAHAIHGKKSIEQYETPGNPLLSAPDRQAMNQKRITEEVQATAEYDDSPETRMMRRAVDTFTPAEGAVAPVETQAKGSFAASTPKVRINEGRESRSVALEFESETDKALYVASQPRKGKLQAEANAYLVAQGYADPTMVESLQSELRDRVETTARKSSGIARIAAFQKPRQAAQAAPGSTQAAPAPIQPAPTPDAANPVINREDPQPAESRPATLPRELAGAKPRYNRGTTEYLPQFESDEDRALFITSQKKLSKRDADYRTFLTGQGYTPEQITEGGIAVRNAIKAATKGAPAGIVSIPRTYARPTGLGKGPVQGNASVSQNPVGDRVQRATEAAKRDPVLKAVRFGGTPLNAKAASLAREIEATSGRTVAWVEGANASFTVPGHENVLFIDRNLQDADVAEHLVHELHHTVQTQFPELAAELESAFSATEQEKGGDQYINNALDAGQTVYAAKIMGSKERKAREAGAYLVGRAVRDVRVLEGIAPNQRSAIRKLVDKMLEVLGLKEKLTPQQKKVKAGLEKVRAALQTRPSLVESKSDVSFNPVPSESIRRQAEAYNKSVGLPPPQDLGYVPVDLARAKKIADWFDEAVSQPRNPDVIAAYQAMKTETKAQYELLVKDGVKFEPWQNQGQPYENSEAVHKDVRENRHLFFFLTEGGFGQAPVDAQSHPMLESSGVTINGKPLLYNDLFRAVHDYYGHAKEGVGFGPRGEENAWLSHSQMYSETARPAMTAETRGQNSWVNYGPNGEFNRANPKQTIYSEQKVLKAPEEFVSFNFRRDEGLDVQNDLGFGGVMKILNRSKHKRVRGLWDKNTGKVYWWDAEEATHDRVATKLNLGPVDGVGEQLKSLLYGIHDGEFFSDRPVFGDSKAPQVLRDLDSKAAEPSGVSLLPIKPKSRKEALAKLETTTLRDAPLNADRGLFGPQPVKKGSVKGDEVARILNERTKALAGQSKAREAEKLERAIAAGIPEAQYQLDQPDSGKSWYKDDIAKMERTMVKLHPSLKNPAHMTVFKAILAITSQGNNPGINLKFADPIYAHWNKTGEILKTQPNGKNWPGTLGENYRLPLGRLESLIKQEGVEGAAKWLLTKHTVGEINAFSEAAGMNANVSGPRDAEVYGMEMFGPKIGVFALNQHGIQEKITKDLWFSRTWNRWMGTMLESGAVVDAPRNDNERDVMDRAVSILADRLGMDASEVQAVLWYYEQQLWKAHGARAESGSYSKAAKSVADGNRYDLERAFTTGEGVRSEEQGEDAGLGGFAFGDSEGGGDSGVSLNPIADFFTRGGKLPDGVMPLNDTREGRIRGQETRARFFMRDLTDAILADTGRKFSELTPAEVKSLDRQLKGGRNAGMGSKTDAALAAMRDHQDMLSVAGVHTGAFKGKAATAAVGNIGKYLNRSFRIFDEGQEWVNRIPQPVRDAARTFFEGQLRQQGKPLHLADVYMDELLQDMAAGGVDKWFHSGKLGAKNISILKKRKNIAPEIRALMGEYSNPLVNYAKSISKTATLVSNHLFLEDVKVASSGTWLFNDDDAPAGFRTEIAAEQSDMMAPLNGMRTSPEIAKAFAEFNRANPLPAWAKWWMKANFLAKSSKTVFSMMTQARNLLGQPFFWALNGHFNFLHLQTALTSALADYRGKGDAGMREYVAELQRLGILGQGINSRELLADMEDAGLFAGDVDDKGKPVSRAMRLGRAFIDPFQKLYAASDHIGKIVGYENELAGVRKVDPSLSMDAAKRIAADRVLDTYPTYARIPSGIQELRRQPFIGPFVSFWYEAMRTAGNSVIYTYQDLKPGTNKAQKVRGARRLAGQVMVAGVPIAASAISRALAGITEEDEDDFREFLPPYSKDNQFVFWGHGKDGVQYTDLSALNPYSNMTDAAMAVVTADSPLEALTDSVAAFFRPLVSEAIFTKAVREAKSNVKESGGRVYSPEDTETSQWADILGHLFKSVEPGTSQRLRQRIVPSFTTGETPYGEKLTPALELLSEGGIKTRTLKYDAALQFEARKFQERSADISNLFLRTLRPGTPSGEIIEQFEAMEERRLTQFQDMHRKTQAVERAGFSSREVWNALLKGGMGQDNARNVIKGQYEPYDITGTSVVEAYRERREDFPLASLVQAYRKSRAKAEKK